MLQASSNGILWTCILAFFPKNLRLLWYCKKFNCLGILAFPLGVFGIHFLTLSHFWKWNWVLEHFLIPHFIWCPKFDHEPKIEVVTNFQWFKMSTIWTRLGFSIYIDPKILDTLKFPNPKLGIHFGIYGAPFLHSHKVFFH